MGVGAGLSGAGGAAVAASDPADLRDIGTVRVFRHDFALEDAI
jgi:hypothetical protein